MVEGHGWVAHFIMIWWLGSNDDDRLAQPIWDQAWWAVVGRTLYDLEMFRDCNHPAGNLPRHGKIHSERDDFPIEPNHFLSDCPTQKKHFRTVARCPTKSATARGTAASTGFSSSTSQRISKHQWLVGNPWHSSRFIRCAGWTREIWWLVGFDVLVRSCLVPN